MSYLIYYKVKRNYLLTDEENKSIEQCLGKYFKNNNHFCIDKYNKKEPEIIFSGKTGLQIPKNVILDDTEIDQILFYISCLKCLVEIKNIINDAEWILYDEYNRKIIWNDIMKIVNNQ